MHLFRSQVKPQAPRRPAPTMRRALNFDNFTRVEDIPGLVSLEDARSCNKVVYRSLGLLHPHTPPRQPLSTPAETRGRRPLPALPLLPAGTRSSAAYAKAPTLRSSNSKPKTSPPRHLFDFHLVSRERVMKRVHANTGSRRL